MNKHPDEKTVLILSLVGIIAPPVSCFSLFMAFRVLKESRARGFETSVPIISVIVSSVMAFVFAVALVLAILLTVSIYHAFYAY